jgi:hypothetical protein
MTTSLTRVGSSLYGKLYGEPIAYYGEFSKALGSVTAGVLLSKAISEPFTDDGWFLKSQDEWELETGLSRREQETARQVLRDAGILLESKKGIPCRLFFKVDFEAVERLIRTPADSPNNGAAPSPGHIYLLHAIGTDRYKIGLASDIPKRMSQLSKQSAFPLALIASHPSCDMSRDEENWHKLFEEQRVHGEWFELSIDQVWVFRDCAKARSEEA